jgi:hypothetical protein
VRGSRYERSKRFLEAVREAEANESEEAADRVFKKVTSKRSKESRG